MPDITFSQLNAKVENLQHYLDGSYLRDITKDVALEAKRDAEKQLDADTGDRRMSGWKLKLGVGFDILSDTEAKVKPRPSGPWSVLDGGRKQGARVPKRKRSVTVSTPWGPKTYTRDNPLRLGSTKGKDTWKRALADMERETPGRVHRHVVTALKKAF